MKEGKLYENIITKSTLGVGIEIEFDLLKEILEEMKASWVDLDEYFEEERSEVARNWINYWLGGKNENVEC